MAASFMYGRTHQDSARGREGASPGGKGGTVSSPSRSLRGDRLLLLRRADHFSGLLQNAAGFQVVCPVGVAGEAFAPAALAVAVIEAPAIAFLFQHLQHGMLVLLAVGLAVR